MNSGDISTPHLELLVTDRCICLQGFVKNYQALVVCRFILGFFEAGGVAILLHDLYILANTLKGFFPGCVYLVSCWYVRYELQKR
jgi:hypothetical protein